MTSVDEQLFLVARALADPIRIKILHLVASGHRSNPTSCCSRGMCVCDLQEALEMKQSKVSYHLKELKNAQLIQERKEGKWNYYTINPSVFRSFCQGLNERFFLDSTDTDLDSAQKDPT